ncbi:MAG: ECF transporter S component [Clostridiales bacterium]|nr:ECF transporter S component [Clostridiales bacterium]
MNKKILNTVYTAMVAAMIFLLTRFVQVPVASGYVHFGDALIYIVASTLGGGLSLFAAALGSVLADVTSGWAVYAPVTLIIKVLIAIPFALVNKKSEKILTPLTALFTILSGAITVLGYFLANCVIDKAYAVVDIPGNLIQTVGSAVVFIVLAAAFDAGKLKKRLFKKQM